MPGIDMAQELGNTRVTNVVLLGGVSALLPVQAATWESVLKERVPPRFIDVNLRAFREGREWMEGRK
jgi:indolepyruvate ferredoxin oxidoreductase beta subunit